MRDFDDELARLLGYVCPSCGARTSELVDAPEGRRAAGVTHADGCPEVTPSAAVYDFGDDSDWRP